jgi:flagellar motor component MotA
MEKDMSQKTKTKKSKKTVEGLEAFEMMLDEMQKEGILESDNKDETKSLKDRVTKLETELEFVKDLLARVISGDKESKCKSGTEKSCTKTKEKQLLNG